MKRISLSEIEQKHRKLTYQQLYAYILGQIAENRLSPVRASATNGKKPALYNSYWIVEKKPDYTGLMDELKFRICPQISTDYYLRHPDHYEKDRRWVLLLNEFLISHADWLKEPVSLNERSYMIWKREKFLQQEQGRKILRRCGLGTGALNYYETSEPLVYYISDREIPQNLLILENKDPFYSMRMCLMENRSEGKILGQRIGTLIYGAGKGILRSFHDYSFCIEPFMNAAQNQILYFGDLDYEGIGIFEKLAENFHDEHEIIPFREAYIAMLEKAQMGRMEELPETKEKQNRTITGLFFSYFAEPEIGKMKKILQADRYIPQEILNIQDFSGNGGNTPDAI